MITWSPPTCKICKTRVAVNWREAEDDDAPGACAECSYACNDSECCGVHRHWMADTIEALAAMEREEHATREGSGLGSQG